MSTSRLQAIATALCIGLLGGSLFSWLGLPLPWMLGPLFCVGAAGISGVRVGEIRGGRQAGQLVVGTALGLYFSPEVTRHVLNLGGYIMGAAFTGIAIGVAGSYILKRTSGMDATTAFFASVPGGASEMAVLAERAGARFDQVALSHSIRVLMVVSTVPIAVTLTGASGHDIYTQAASIISFPGLVVLALLASCLAFVFMKAGIPNAWLLGPLTVSVALTVNGHSLTAIPAPLTVIAQVLIGCSLGSRFKPSLRNESRRLMLGIIVSSAFNLSLSVLMGLSIAWMNGAPAPTMVLATAPGGLSEMCITAKILQLGVPLVTSYQVTRLAIVVTFSLPTWRLLQAIRLRFGKTAS